MRLTAFTYLALAIVSNECRSIGQDALEKIAAILAEDREAGSGSSELDESNIKLPDIGVSKHTNDTKGGDKASSDGHVKTSKDGKDQVETGQWVVKDDDGHVCLEAKFSANFKVTPHSSMGKMLDFSIRVPPEAEVDQQKSDCSKRLLSLKFGDNIFEVQFVDDEEDSNKAYARNINMDYVVDGDGNIAEVAAEDIGQAIAGAGVSTGQRSFSGPGVGLTKSAAGKVYQNVKGNVIMDPSDPEATVELTDVEYEKKDGGKADESSSFSSYLTSAVDSVESTVSGLVSTVTSTVSSLVGGNAAAATLAVGALGAGGGGAILAKKNNTRKKKEQAEAKEAELVADAAEAKETKPTETKETKPAETKVKMVDSDDNVIEKEEQGATGGADETTPLLPHIPHIPHSVDELLEDVMSLDTSKTLEKLKKGIWIWPGGGKKK
ncbi:hypothetical protein HDE_09839 [Halotydeus destructor]|nr:hypothetical protein HDE_09839 [Halotydeus destructor]